MSIPKLKVYRLDQDYSSAFDSDVQSLENDELLPVVPKDLNVFNAEELVGVRPRRDSRIVYRPGTRTRTWLPMLSEQGGSMSPRKTESALCERMVGGHVNCGIYVRTVKKKPDRFPVSDLSAGFFGYSFPRDGESEFDFGSMGDTAGGSVSVWHVDSISGESLTGRKLESVSGSSLLWAELPSDFAFPAGYSQEPGDEVSPGEHCVVSVDNSSRTWSIRHLDLWKRASQSCFRTFSEEVRNGYGPDGRIVSLPSEASSFHQDTMVGVEIGDTIYKSAIWEGGYEGGDYHGFNSPKTGGIFFEYEKYEELSDAHGADGIPVNPTDGASLHYGLQFGSIYNGEKGGRMVSQSSPSDSVLEGNYCYRRSVFPMRMLVGKAPGDSDADFSADAEIMVSGEKCWCEFRAKRSWMLDGDCRPIAFERRTGADGKRYFSPLSEELQIGALSPVFSEDGTGLNGNVSYRVTFRPDYYRKGISSGYAFPTEVFLMYTDSEDGQGGIFGFDYEYGSGDFKSMQRGMAYGSSSVDYGKAFRRFEVLAVDADYGYNASRDLLMVRDLRAGSASVEVPFGLVGLMNRDGATSFGGRGNPRIYFNGVKVYDGASVKGTGYSVSFVLPGESSPGRISVQADPGVELPTDMMIVCHEEHPVSYSKGADGANPWCMGYRVVCHEKVKRADLFVSSFPNWVSGHLNNSPDVFVGNTKYSGTDTTTYATDGIYPCHVEDGYTIYYPEGAVKMSEPVEQLDYSDIRNFASGISSKIVIEDSTTDDDLKPYYRKVVVNHAHYDGLFNVLRGRMSCYSIGGGKARYALLEDDSYADSAGRRMVVHEDDNMRLVLESGSEQFPEIRSSDRNKREVCEIFLEFGAQAKSYVRVNTQTDRITAIDFTPNGNSESDLIVLLNREYSGRAETVTRSQFDDRWERVHVNWTEGRYVLRPGSKNEYVFTDDQSVAVRPCLVVGTEIEGEDSPDHFKRKCSWTPLPETEAMFGEDETVSDAYGSIPFFRYSNAAWHYDVIFEMLSVRKSNADGVGRMKSVEFIIYKVDKE